MIGLLGTLALLAVGLGLLWILQRRLIYFPTAAVPEPSAVGLAGVEPVSFSTDDGLELQAWFVPAQPPAGPAAPRITVLMLNGNAGNRAHRAPLALALRRHGIHVLLTDYRGFGGNPGTPTETGLAADARAARQYLLGRPDVDPSRLVYFGESLGSAVAARLAAEHPPAALILRSPFTSMADVGQHHYPALPVASLLQDRFPTLDHIRRLEAPLLVIAGDRDRIVPLEYSQRLFQEAPEPKTLVLVPGADHNDAALLMSPVMIDSIVRFVRRS